ncbi:MAG: type II toxin-antitoxin system HicB family antitoxin [Pseudomonadales bacterium]|nr:type II toxin-antitoxin system HicB family antitoxin [Pseudomonadales bacterium]
MTKLDSSPVRLNVSIPRYAVARLDSYAKKHRLTRSALIVNATEEYIDKPFQCGECIKVWTIG